MLREIISGGTTYPHDPSRRGLQNFYYRDCTNHCPGCGRTHWQIGRFSAECCFCSTALALTETATMGAGTFRTHLPQI